MPNISDTISYKEMNTTSLFCDLDFGVYPHHSCMITDDGKPPVASTAHTYYIKLTFKKQCLIWKYFEFWNPPGFFSFIRLLCHSRSTLEVNLLAKKQNNAERYIANVQNSVYTIQRQKNRKMPKDVKGEVKLSCGM